MKEAAISETFIRVLFRQMVGMNSDRITYETVSLVLPNGRAAVAHKH